MGIFLSSYEVFDIRSRVWSFSCIDTGTRNKVIVDTETRDGWARAESMTETGPMGAHSADVICLDKLCQDHMPTS